MALTLDQLTIVRGELGDAEPPDDGELDDLHDLFGGLVGVVRYIWRKRLANLLNSPASFAVPGEYSQSVAANILAIRQRLRELSGYPDDSDVIPPNAEVGAMHIVPLVRAGQDR